MCSTSNSPSFKERVQYYISRKKQIEAEYKSKMEALNEEASTDILANCPIKVGDVYVTESNNAWGVKRQYYKIAKVDATVDDNYHKGVVVRPDYVYESVEFSLAEWNIEVIPNSSDDNFVEF